MHQRILFFLTCLLCTSGFAQMLKGKITDTTGNAIPFARISVLESSYGTVSNALGQFQLQLSPGTYVIQSSAMDYSNRTDTVVISDKVTLLEITLTEQGEDLPETIITSRSRKDLGKEIMKQVIDKRKYFRDLTSTWSCETYCVSSLEKELKDSLYKDSVISRKKMNFTEWHGTSYYEAPGKYKDVYDGFLDLSEHVSGASVSVSFGPLEDDILEPYTFNPVNPYLFVNGISDADINLFDNLIQSTGLSQRPLISPMSGSAFLYYNFFVERSFYEKGQKIYEIKVQPRFREEALFDGSLYIRDSIWELVSFDLGINKGALTYLHQIRIITDFEKNGERILPVRREFVYTLKEGSHLIHGNIRMRHSNYAFNLKDHSGKFWEETKFYQPESFTRDTSFWDSIRPFQLKPEELRFIAQQDSITKHLQSESYLHEQDSVFNTLSVWDFLFNGVGFRNTFKKQEIYFDGLINQVVPFGVGGYRHRLSVSYDKTFHNNHHLSLHPTADYGVTNRDFKWELGASYLYNPRRFSKFFIELGDVYDFMNNYQSIQGTFAPANRVWNRKLEINHRMELLNGLYFKCGFQYSNRQSITGITYPSWVDQFGFFSIPEPFEGYKVFMTELEFSYHFRQKHLLKGNQKVIVGSQWPVLTLQYKKGYPHLFGGQSDFDFMELRLTDEIHFGTFGLSEYKLISGAFLRKNDLRLVEHKFFRTSDKFFFSNPINSLQLLDTALNTSNSYLQFNAIHHFNGCFLNKIWLINKLKLQETVGGSLLLIPDAHFAQAELYVGLERQLRIRKSIFKLGVYAVTAGSTFDKANTHIKFGINFYDAFRNKWNY